MFISHLDIFFVRCLLMLFCPFFSKLGFYFVSLVICSSSVYSGTLEKVVKYKHWSCLLNLWLSFLYAFLVVSCDEQMVFILMMLNISGGFLFLLRLLLLFTILDTFVSLRSRRFFPLFSFRNLIVSLDISRSVIHLKLLFVCGLK